MQVFVLFGIGYHRERSLLARKIVLASAALYFAANVPGFAPLACNGGRVELGNWSWEKPEAVAFKSPTGPPLIRLDKALIKSTRCEVAYRFASDRRNVLPCIAGG